MKEQPYYTSLLTKEFFEQRYVNESLSFPKIKELLQSQGHNIATGTIYKYAKKLKIGRSPSDARRRLFKEYIDYNVTYMNEEMLECLDGFLLGDGNISISRSHVKTARATCGVQFEEFCRYLMSWSTPYFPTIKSYKLLSMSSGMVWNGRTKFHPDFFKQYSRWYTSNLEGEKEKQPPDDVRITPKSVMLWYLGDGSVVQQNNTITLRLSTDAFSTESVEFLAQKLTGIGIKSHRNNDNRILVETRYIPAFFDFIGKKSPVRCYDYKFALPEWRFTAKRMKDVAKEIGITYNRLSYYVKIKKVPFIRVSQKGKPCFLENQVEIINKMHLAGEI
jgi:hypothetical protein